MLNKIFNSHKIIIFYYMVTIFDIQQNFCQLSLLYVSSLLQWSREVQKNLLEIDHYILPWDRVSILITPVFRVHWEKSQWARNGGYSVMFDLLITVKYSYRTIVSVSIITRSFNESLSADHLIKKNFLRIEIHSNQSKVVNWVDFWTFRIKQYLVYLISRDGILK